MVVAEEGLEPPTRGLLLRVSVFLLIFFNVLDTLYETLYVTFLSSRHQSTYLKSTFSRCIYNALTHRFAHEMRMLFRIRNDSRQPTVIPQKENDTGGYSTAQSGYASCMS